MKFLTKAFIYVIASSAILMYSTSVTTGTGRELDDYPSSSVASVSTAPGHLTSNRIHHRAPSRNRIITRNGINTRTHIRGVTDFLLRHTNTNTNNKPEPIPSHMHRHMQSNGVDLLQWEPVGDVIVGQAAYDGSGASIAMSNDGHTIAIGGLASDSPGQVRLYRLDGEKQWKILGTEINGREPDGGFGWSLDLSADGKRVVIGGPWASTWTGVVRIFEIAGDWEQVGTDLVGNNEGDLFGFSVSMSGDGLIIAVGAIGDIDNNGSDSGSLQMFHDDSGSWKNIHQLFGDAAKDWFGRSVSLSDDASVLFVGAPGRNNASPGYVKYIKIDKRSDGTIELIQPEIKFNGNYFGDRFGERVSLSGDGKYLAVSGYNNAIVKIYKMSESGLEQVGQNIPVSSQWAPTSFANDGKRIMVGDGSTSDLGTGAGRAQVFDLVDEKWKQTGDNLCAFDEDTCTYGGQFGWSVAMSGDGLTVAAGTPDSDLNEKTDSGHVRVFSLVQVQAPTSDPVTPQASSLTIGLICGVGGIVIGVLLVMAASMVRRQKKKTLVTTYEKTPVGPDQGKNEKPSSPLVSFPITNEAGPTSKV